jgi:GNAT superfamily N-acetyltransferase
MPVTPRRSWIWPLSWRSLSPSPGPFYANGPVAWVEEVFVRGQHRGCGVGRALMSAYEQWAISRDCALVALATRRAAPFYRALGYEESALYHRKILGARAGQ